MIAEFECGCYVVFYNEWKEGKLQCCVEKLMRCKHHKHLEDFTLSNPVNIWKDNTRFIPIMKDGIVLEGVLFLEDAVNSN